ncbi:MAG: TIR domain-containing protein [Candidatus Accumulibacter sp.]|nr:TIR domain-containing protein [Candidatus Accumulibacter conexus]
MSYDAFLSYSREDEDEVTRIAERLRDEANLQVWFDRWELVPGDPWQEKLEEALRQLNTSVVFIGRKGLGNWQAPEVRAALNRNAERKMRVVPVALPGVDVRDERIPLFLKNLDFCLLRSLDDQPNFERLVAGITGVHPRFARAAQAAARPVATAPEPPDPNREAIAYLQGHLENDAISFYVGRGLMSALTPCDITEKLLRSLELIGDEAPAMLPSLDLAANYYAVKSDENRLQTDVASILRQGHLEIPEAYGELALLLRDLCARPAGRGRRRYRHLVITSVLDTMIEQAFLRAGMGFTRFVQSASGKRLDINIYDQVELGAGGFARVTERSGYHHSFPLDSPDDMDRVIEECDARSVSLEQAVAGAPDAAQLATVFNELREPILYKLHGSLDVRDSFTLSTEQYYEAVSRSPAHKAVPEQIAQILSNTPIVCLGSRILDPDFRLSYYLLRECLDVRRGQIRRFTVHPRDLGDQRDCSHQMGLRAWSRLANWATTRYGVEMLDMRSELFLKQLRGGAR